MNLEIIAALSLFAFVSSITPGPNNLMLLSSGATFGFRRSIPHMLGIAIGFAIMVVMVGIGLLKLFDAYPTSYVILKYVSIAYLLYLAWKIARSSADNSSAANSSSPFTFTQAALFQWVNPKAWTMALTAISVYSPERTLESIIIVAIVFAIVNLPSVSFWAAMGQQLTRFLTNQIRLRTFNTAMAGLLVLSLYPVML